MDDTAHEEIAVEINASKAKSEMSTEPNKTLTTANNEPMKSGNNSKNNSSLEEDLLGANSLLMSDSDDDHRGALAAEKNIENIEAPNNKDVGRADNDKDDDYDEKAYSKEDTIESPVKMLIKKKKKFSAILDSDSDEENTKSTTISAKINSDRPKISALIDSDSETENELNQSSNENEIKNTKYQVFDFDEEDSESQVRKKQKSKNIKNRKQKKIKNKLTDSDTDSTSDSATSGNDSQTEALNNEEFETENEMSGVHKNQTEPKQMRTSAKKALDEIQAIQSEQQRLHREAHISIPYHKPKRHTLQEFLKRRTIIKPTSENECSPTVASMRKKPLKMTPEELEEYAKLMEDRAKEAKEFFKSESESEDEEIKPNPGVVNLQETNDFSEQLTAEFVAQNDTEMLTSINLGESASEATVDAGDIDNDVTPIERMDFESLEQESSEFSLAQAENKEIKEVEESEEIATCSTQPVVTEVLELPRLDLSTLHIAEEQRENALSPSKAFKSDEKIENPKTSLLNELQSTESPRLKGDANMLIDLDSGDLIAKKPTGADDLLKRLLATHKAKKAKNNDTVNILSTENGKLEMTTVNFHHSDETEVNKEQKPGAAYIKLKDNLKTLIKKKRLEELRKKQEDENEYNKCLEDDEDVYETDDKDEEYEIEDDKKVKLKKEKSKLLEIVIDEEENAFQYDDNVEDGAEQASEEETGPTNEDSENFNDFKEEAAIEAESDEDFDSSASASDEDEENHQQNEQSDATAFKEPLTITQRKSRIIKAFSSDSEHEEEDDDRDLLKTQLPIAVSNVITPLFGAIDSPLKKSLSRLISSKANDDIENTQELMALCSGSFDATQKPTSTTDTETVIISQIPMTLQSTQTDTTRELLALCSGSFDSENHQTQAQQSTVLEPTETETQHPQQTRPTGYKILSSDEEEAAVVKSTQDRVKKLRKKLKKGQTKLGFSDEEDQYEENVGSVQQEADNDFMEDAVDMPETYVEYDSEENEIIVEMTKKDCINRAGNFFEKEAELSESEWGSADEDEKNLDHYDIELGDEDDFDREKLQQELGQIHARKMLDEDIREVRKIQEMLFEDEENDGVGRQRQFRWKNAESGFSLDDRNEEGSFNGAESGDEEQKQEHLWRKIRFEREQLLREQGIIGSSQELTTTTTVGDKTITTPIIGSNGKKIQIVTKKSTLTNTAASRGSPFLISSTSKKSNASTLEALATQSLTPPSTASILQPKVARGSFLMRDKDTLTKFANFTKGFTATTNLEDDETAGTVSIKSVKAKNFVFATLTKEEHEHLKRKADDLINSSSDNGTNFMKKPRTSQNAPTAGKQCFIDKLLL